jgi:hypothetical protein
MGSGVGSGSLASRAAATLVVGAALALYAPLTEARPAPGPDRPTQGPLHRPPGAADLEWLELGPPARSEHVSVLDSRHRRLVVFGGRTTEKYEGAALSNDLWILTLGREPRWERAAALGESPSPRLGSAAVFDPPRQRMLLIGGRDSTGLLNDLWELSLRGRPRWRQLAASGPPPSARYRHTATLDPMNDRVLVFGGWDGWHTNDLWQLSLSDPPAWMQLHPDGRTPGPRSMHSAVFVPDLGAMVVFGGAGPVFCPGIFTCAQQTTDVWLLSLSGPPTWTDLTPNITGPAPCGIEAHSVAYDAAAKRMIVIGGYGEYNPGFECFGGIAREWSLSIQDLKWAELVPGPERPRARYFASAVLDSEERRVLVYGGGGGTPYADVWALALDGAPSWSRVTPAAGMPTSTGYSGWSGVPSHIHYDGRRDRLITYDGSQVWTYSLSGRRDWSAMSTIGAAPSIPTGATEVYDPVRNRFIVHGGWDGSRVLSETWELSLEGQPTWSRIPTTGRIPASYNSEAIYDPVRRRMILSGGSQTASSSLDSVWVLPLDDEPRWSSLAAFIPTRPRSGHAAVYDQRHDRMVVFGGGWEDADSWWTLNDVWALALSGSPGWTQLNAGGSSPDLPPRRAFSRLVYDPVGDRTILVGGFVPGAFARGPFDDAWEFRLGDLRWDRIPPQGAPVPLWRSPGGAYDSRRDRIILFENDWLWSLASMRKATRGGERLSSEEEHQPDEPDTRATLALSFGVGGTNPFSENLVVELSLPTAAPAVLELFDVAGRRVWARDLSGLEGGIQRVQLQGMGRLRPGVFLLRLTQADQSLGLRVIHVRS